MKKSCLNRFLFLCLTGFFCVQTMAQGPYAPAVGVDGTTAIHKDHVAIMDWAESCTLYRGYQDIANKSLGQTDVGSSASAEGVVDGGVVSLGDSGVAVLTFSVPIANTLGPDFAVFENSFDNNFLELAFVEVSSDGVNFFRFEAVSLTDTTIQTGTFGNTDPTNLYNLAGKYRAQYGTPFDLEELDGIVGLDINNITHVKIIDVIGTIDDQYATRDSQGNKINDPYPTDFGAGGFDLDGVAVLGDITALEEVKTNDFFIYPNPSNDFIYISDNELFNFVVKDILGKEIIRDFSNKLNVSSLANGVYFIAVNNQIFRFVKN